MKKDKLQPKKKLNLMNKISNLTFEFSGNPNNYNVASHVEKVRVIYRYFSCSQHREEFLNGSILFASDTKNRYIQESHNGISDKYEYRNNIGTFAFEYAISCSTELLDNSKPNIMISDIVGFSNAIYKSIKANRNHKIIWVSEEERKIIITRAPSHEISGFKGEFIYPDETSTSFTRVGGYKREYVDKNILFDDKKLVNDSPIYVAANARNGNIEYADEQEYRIHLNTSDIEHNNHFYTPLYKHIKYISIYCPEIRDFCEPINRSTF